MRRWRFILGTGAILCACSLTQAAAEIRPHSFSFTPFAGGYMFEGNQDLDDDLLMGAGFGYNYTESFGVEPVFSYISTQNELTGLDVDGYIYHVDGLIHLLPDQRIVPYLALGLGGITLNPAGGDSDTDGLFNWGLGLKMFMTHNLALRADVRHLLTFSDVYNNLASTLGLTFQFGGAPARPAEAAPAAAAAPARPMDSDGDGVPDSRDACPGTPPGTPVDSKGCPKDSDGDGIYDYLDKCPDTPKGTKVDAEGCPLKKEVCVYLDVKFDFDQWDIKPQYHDELQKVADFMKGHPQSKATIKGYTDYIGTEEYNEQLSERRAQSLKMYLVDNFGIAGDRIITMGLGENNPMATNQTAMGRQLNRRASDVICTFEIQLME